MKLNLLKRIANRKKAGTDNGDSPQNQAAKLQLITIAFLEQALADLKTTLDSSGEQARGAYI